MADEIQIQPSSSSEILDLLFIASLDKGQATTLMGNLPQGQRSERLQGSDWEQQDPIIARPNLMRTRSGVSYRQETTSTKAEGELTMTGVLKATSAWGQATVRKWTSRGTCKTRGRAQVMRGGATWGTHKERWGAQRRAPPLRRRDIATWGRKLWDIR